MSVIRNLAGQTAIYGLSHIAARLLNYFLMPLHTWFFSKDQYGIVGEMYAYVAFLVVLLTYGMETAFFRFFNQNKDDQPRVYSTALISLIVSSTAFIILCSINAQPIANWLGYPNHSEYVIWFSMIVGFDAISALPLARLRAENKAKTFAKVNLISIGVNIGLNVLFLTLIMDPEGEIGIGYIFIANLLASIVKLALLFPQIARQKLVFVYDIWVKLIKYAWPILFFGLAGVINETLDRILIKDLRTDYWIEQGYFIKKAQTMALAENGIYSAVYKISMLITIFIQAFRYAAEPFFFSEANKEDAKKTYSRVMTYFVIVVSTLFLGVMLYLDVIKYVILPNHVYWDGLKVVPVLLLANIFIGIYFNQSVWYKLTDKTIWGLYLSLIGAVITIVLNLALIPKYSYVGSAWATFAAYGAMMVASYYFGQKHYRIRYNLKKIIFYVGLALLLYFLSLLLTFDRVVLDYIIKTLLFGFYVFIIWGLERPHLLFKK